MSDSSVARISADDAMIFSELRRRLAAFVAELKGAAPPKSVQRSFLNSLLQDLYLVEGWLSADQADGTGWSEAALDASLAKLSLGIRLCPELRADIAVLIDELGRLRRGRREWAAARQMLQSLLDELPELGLRREARERLLQDDGGLALEALAAWGIDSGGPPLGFEAVGRCIESLALHLALVEAEGERGPGDQPVRVALGALEEWLLARGARALSPQLGDLAGGEESAVFRRGALGATLRGAVDRVVAAGYRYGGVLLARPTVILSPGSGSEVLALARAQLAACPPSEEKAAFAARLGSLRARLWATLEDAEAGVEDCGLATLDLAEAMRRGPSAPKSSALIRALHADLSDAGLEVVMARVGERHDPEDTARVEAMFSKDAPADRILSVDAWGLRSARRWLRRPAYTVSAGAAPPTFLGELFAAIDAVAGCEAWRRALEDGRDLWPKDRGAAIGRVLLGALGRGPRALRDRLAPAALEALPVFASEALSSAPFWHDLPALFRGWVDARESVDSEAFRALLTPYLRAAEGGELRPIDVLNAGFAAAARDRGPGGRRVLTWLWARLKGLGSEELAEPVEARRLARRLSATLAALWGRPEDAALRDVGLAAIEAAGGAVYPQPGGSLAACAAPEEAFAYMETRYSEAKRGRAIEVEAPAVVLPGGERALGFALLSLGPRPRVLEWLEGPEAASSSLAWARERLAAELTRCDRQALLAELHGEGDERARWRREARELFAEEELGVEGDPALEDLRRLVRDELR